MCPHLHNLPENLRIIDWSPKQFAEQFRRWLIAYALAYINQQFPKIGTCPLFINILCKTVFFIYGDLAVPGLNLFFFDDLDPDPYY